MLASQLLRTNPDIDKALALIELYESAFDEIRALETFDVELPCLDIKRDDIEFIPDEVGADDADDIIREVQETALTLIKEEIGDVLDVEYVGFQEVGDVLDEMESAIEWSMKSALV